MQVMITGNMIIGAGVLLIVVGLAYKFGLLGWFGNLPGDIRYEGKNSSFYFPVVTMIVVSVILSLLLSLFRK
ncbi:MAG: DUF2905 domain-containing protein [Thiovulaceae bacterium]|nr:DUF2905 domain-containing protein [Sulfurimonadaceae bacterium]